MSLSCYLSKPHFFGFIKQTGPLSDHSNGNAESYFMFVSAEQTDAVTGTFTDLQSALVVGEQHPKECFSFWFQSQVKSLIV